MRRADREVTDPAQMREIIQNCECCRLGYYDEENDEVYIVPISYGYAPEENALYFHGASAGRKYELMQKRPRVGFEMDVSFKVIPGETACKHSCRFQSIIGTGVIEELFSFEEKKRGLNLVMEHYTGNGTWEYPDSAIEHVAVFKLTIEKMTGKNHD